jgi:hypothetical protein
MSNKNKSFDCKGNEEADNLLYMIESNSVLSESFTQNVRNIVLVILSNLDKNEDWVEGEIIKLRDEMQWLTIFSERFIGQLIGQLLLSLNRQRALNNWMSKEKQ